MERTMSMAVRLWMDEAELKRPDLKQFPLGGKGEPVARAPVLAEVKRWILQPFMGGRNEQRTTYINMACSGPANSRSLCQD